MLSIFQFSQETCSQPIAVLLIGSAGIAAADGWASGGAGGSPLTSWSRIWRCSGRPGQSGFLYGMQAPGKPGSGKQTMSPMMQHSPAPTLQSAVVVHMPGIPPSTLGIPVPLLTALVVATLVELLLELELALLELLELLEPPPLPLPPLPLPLPLPLLVLPTFVPLVVVAVPPLPPNATVTAKPARAARVFGNVRRREALMSGGP